MINVIGAVHALLGRTFVYRLLTAEEVARAGSGRIGLIRLVVGRQSASWHAGEVSSPVLGALYAELASGAGGEDLMFAVSRYLRLWNLPLWGAGFAPRSAYTSALQGRHAVLHLPGLPLTAQSLDKLGLQLGTGSRDLREALLAPGWDIRPQSASALAEQLLRAARQASTADRPIWERRFQGKRVTLLDTPHISTGSTLADLIARPESQSRIGVWELLVDYVLRQLHDDERQTTLAYAAARGSLTWAQAACEAGHPPATGERTRRKIKRLREEYTRRHPETGGWIR
ncbi:hypothetical protein [Kitasatospora cineracea]|nr:hypothetical protein [Kitasatospora cineracea]